MELARDPPAVPWLCALARQPDAGAIVRNRLCKGADGRLHLAPHLERRAEAVFEDDGRGSAPLHQESQPPPLVRHVGKPLVTQRQDARNRREHEGHAAERPIQAHRWRFPAREAGAAPRPIMMTLVSG